MIVFVEYLLWAEAVEYQLGLWRIKKKKNKLDFCLEELTIKLRKANINKCGNLKISPRNILLHTEQFNPDLNATEIIAKGLVRMGKGWCRKGFVVLQLYYYDYYYYLS